MITIKKKSRQVAKPNQAMILQNTRGKQKMYFCEIWQVKIIKPKARVLVKVPETITPSC